MQENNETHFKWYGPVLRREERILLRQVLGAEIAGKREAKPMVEG